MSDCIREQSIADDRLFAHELHCDLNRKTRSSQAQNHRYPKTSRKPVH